MALVVPDLGEVELLRRMLRPETGDADTLKLKLYKNNYTPVKASVLANFTECDFDGYAAADLDPANWDGPTSTAGVAVTVNSAGATTWYATSGSQNAYGYYVTNHDGSVVLWAERFPSAPLTISTTIPALVVPVMQLHSESQP